MKSFIRSYSEGSCGDLQFWLLLRINFNWVTMVTLGVGYVILTWTKLGKFTYVIPMNLYDYIKKQVQRYQ